MKKLKVGIVGCGAIGSIIAKTIETKFAKNARLIGICDSNPDAIRKLQAKLRKNVPNLNLGSLIKKSDFIIEAASAAVSAEIAKKAISSDCDILVMSVGGLLGKEKIFSYARKKGVSVYLPSGAICGLDGLKALSLSNIKSITLTTRKPPRSLPERFSNIKKETMIFKGSVKEAVKKFPKNINVAVALSLAAGGVKNIVVRIIASPEYRRNMHEIEIISSAGKILTRTENVPTPANPKTSYLAVLSAIATLKQIFNSVRVGT